MSKPADDVLAHFGIKGMKWGVRRSEAQLARARQGDSEDFTTSRQLKSTPNRKLSTSELKKLNERLQLEKTNRELTAGSALEKVKRGNNIANTLLAVGITANAAIAFANSPAGQALKNAIMKK